jgi:hypothetical protein
MSIPKITLLTAITVMSTCVKLSAQTFMHSVGANISVMSGTIKTDYSSSSESIMLTHVSYFPRILITEGENSSLSFGIPVGVGVGLATDTYNSGSGVFWSFDAPAVIDYNIGVKSTQDNDSRFGGYFGAGFGYTFANWTYDGKSTSNVNSYGPLVRAGMRFGFPQPGCKCGHVLQNRNGNFQV